MIKKVFLILPFVSCTLAYSQPNQETIDSLEYILSASKNDSVKSRTYSRLYYNYVDSDINKAEEYAKRKLEFANKLNKAQFQAAAHRLMGSHTAAQGEFVKAKRHLKLSIQYSEQVRDTLGIGDALTSLGIVYDRLGDHVSSIDTYQKALKICEKYDDKESISLILTNMGVLHSNQGNHHKGIELFKESINVYESQGDSVSMAINLGNIGALYERLEQYEDALLYMRQCYEVELKVGNTSFKAWSEGNLGSIYTKLNDIDNALKYNRSALLKYIDLKDENGQSVIYYNLGEAYAYNKQYKHSEVNFEKSKILAHKTGDFENLKNAYDGLAQLYEEIGNYKKAYSHHKLYKQYQDSIFNTERNKSINELTAAYDAETKENEISALQKDKELNRLELSQQKDQKNLLLLASSLLAVFVISILIFTSQLNRNKSKLEKMNRQLVASENELAKLNETKDRFFAIIAHDLRGAVTSFQGIGQVIKNHLKKGRIERIGTVAERIDASSSQLNSLLDNLLNWSVSQLGNIPFHPRKLRLKGAIEDVIVIFQEAANAKNIELSFEIPDDVYVMADQNGLSVVLRNLVNNALKFTDDGGKVNLEVEHQQNFVCVKVSDSGIGIPSDKLKSLFLIDENKSTSGTKGEKGTGLGLNLVYEFVKLHNGNIDVNSEVGRGTTFNFSLPQA